MLNSGLFAISSAKLAETKESIDSLKFFYSSSSFPIMFMLEGIFIFKKVLRINTAFIMALPSNVPFDCTLGKTGFSVFFANDI